jgi:rhodanese-related sulfurtransferase
VIDPLPSYDGEFITAEELMRTIKEAEAAGCVDQDDKPILTILDLKTDNFLQEGTPSPGIRTECPTIRAWFDDLSDEAVRNRIPRDGMVVTVTETGNRDQCVMRYLSKFGYTNIAGLQFGMRKWIKNDFPVTTP